MSKTAKEIMMEKLAADKAKKTGGGPRPRAGGDLYFPFWQIQNGQSATVRLLPDGNANNPYFWVVRETIELPFDGQVGGEYATSETVTATVPCMHMFGEDCPIMAETKPWWDMGGEWEAQARKYWKKKAFIFQGFVVNSPFAEQNAPENPIRVINAKKSLYEIIEKSVSDPEIEDLPTDFQGGRDFKIVKTQQGGFPNYTTSSWSFRSRALSEAELVAIEQFGLFDLSTFLGKKPDSDGVAMLKAMFHDSLAGKPFDFASYGEHFRAYRSRRDRDSASNAASPSAAASPASSPRPAPAASPRREEAAPSAREEQSAPDVQTAPAAEAGGRPDASTILARIRAKASTNGA